jgi:hypothetical protein
VSYLQILRKYCCEKLFSNGRTKMPKSKDRASSNRGNGGCSFKEFLEKYLPEIKMEQHKLDEARGYSGSSAEHGEYAAKLYDFLVWDVRARTHRFTNMLELLGFVWLCAPGGQDVNLMTAAEQLWDSYECHSG